MLDRLRSHSFSYQAPVLVCLLAILLLLVLPTGFEGALIHQEAERCTARVLDYRRLRHHRHRPGPLW